MERKKQLTKIAAFTVIALVVLINAQSEYEKGSVTVIGYDENNNQVTSTFLIHLHPTDNPTDSSFIQAQEGVGIYSDVDPGEYFIWAGGVAYHKSWQGKDCPFTINAGQHITKKIMFYPGTGTINCAYYPGTTTTSTTLATTTTSTPTSTTLPEVGCYGTHCTASSEGFLAGYGPYKFYADALVHTGRYCTIDSALLVIQKSDQTTTRKKIDRDRIIKVEDTSGDSIGVEFRTGQQLNGVEYVMFDIKSSSDAEPADPPGAFTISQSGYKDYQGYGFKVEYLTHGTRCEIDGGDLEIRKPDGAVLQDYIPVEGRIIVDDYSITCMDAYSAEGVSYMKIHVEPAEINCTDTDGGIDINMRGVCSDYSGSYVDECFNDSFIREYFCDGRVCRGRLLGCFEGDCVDGACCGLETDELSDLVVVDARFSPANPKVGDILMVYVTVRNQGLEESPQTWVRVIEQRGWYNAAKVSALPPGGEDFRVIQLHVHDVHATYNPHHFDIEVDYLNRVHESDENNNILERELTVSEVDIALNCSQYCAVYGYDYGVCKTECGLAEKVFMGRYCQHKTDMCCCGTLQPPTPPAPPNRIMKQLDGGWNLVALSGYGGIDKGSCLNIYGFVYFEGDLYTIQDLEDKLGSRGLKNYLRTHAFWVYSPTRCQMEFLLDEYSSYGEISLLGGWNFIPVTEDMVSRSLEEFRGDCVFLGGFMWDAVKQGWVELSDEYRFDEGDVFTGFVWYAGGGCNLGGVVEPTTTTLVGGWT